MNISAGNVLEIRIALIPDKIRLVEISLLFKLSQYFENYRLKKDLGLVSRSWKGGQIDPLKIYTYN